MKPRLIFFLLIIIKLAGSSHLLFAQDWQWEWAKNNQESIVGPFLKVLTNDLDNDLYFGTGYVDSIVFPDTVFTHSYNQPTNNYAIAWYNHNGVYKNAIDFYTSSGEMIYPATAFTDNESNIYLAMNFQVEMNFLDTTLYNTTYPIFQFHTDIGIIKLNAQNQVIWMSVIGCSLSDYLHGFSISDDGYIYILTEHTGGLPVHFLGQDTLTNSIPTSQDYIVLSKLDKNGLIKWQTTFSGYYSGESLSIGKDGNLYISGKTTIDIWIPNDTIINPVHDPPYPIPFLISFSPEGQFIGGSFMDNGLWAHRYKIDAMSNIYTKGTVIDTMIIHQDTIIAPDDYYQHILLKMDQNFQPIWYKQFEDALNQNLLGFNITLKNNHLYFLAIAEGEISFGDTILNLDYSQNLIFGMYSQDGELRNLITTYSIHDIGFGNYIVDHSNNIVVSGNFKYSAIFGNDTIYSTILNEIDGFIAKIKTCNLPIVNLGPDTTILQNDTLFITVPDQYDTYLWSNGDNTNNTVFFGNDFGIGTFPIWIEVTDGPCTETDTLLLTIKSEFGIYEIGNLILNIYPNPFTDNFMIEIKPDFQKIEIYDLNGLIKFTKELDLPINNSLRIGTENLNQGIYILTITTPDKKLIKKIIKI